MGDNLWVRCTVFTKVFCLPPKSKAQLKSKGEILPRKHLGYPSTEAKEGIFAVLCISTGIMGPISAVLITRNEAANLEATLRALTWTEEGKVFLNELKSTWQELVHALSVPYFL